ncbi:MAG: bacteriocin [Leifsonia xyli]|uniref:Bacteriocin n=1 Tax=Ancylobacter novellus TaxID=921 RepID=A0A2W5KJR5_ANCNO|nr:MAG: bacteriocin [Ancylobacter novellus]PZQ88595.1 MAG: bacteriocin [Leifsonia xyli]
MNNLYRDLAPISAGAWRQIEEEAARTLKRYMGARRVVDLHGPSGGELASVGTGHLKPLGSLDGEVQASLRESKPLVQLRRPFKLTRSAIDDVERGSNDSDWSPLKEAARRIAYAEDRAVFEGYAAGAIEGFRQVASNPSLTLPAEPDAYPEVVAAAVNELRMSGVEGPYCLVLGQAPFTLINGASESGYPVAKHLRQLVDEEIVWSPALSGGIVLSTRGGDFDLYLGQDVSIGYLSHTADEVELYLQETFTFIMQTSEAAVLLQGAG